jgi:hypothetical protein
MAYFKCNERYPYDADTVTAVASPNCYFQVFLGGTISSRSQDIGLLSCVVTQLYYHVSILLKKATRFLSMTYCDQLVIREETLH